MSPVLNVADKLYLGSQPVKKVFMGVVKVWEDWTPKSFPGLTVWLDASKLALADGAAVDSWPDLSGQGHNGAIVGTPSPIVRANALNGQRVVRFSLNEGRVRGVNGISGSGLPNPAYNFTVIYLVRQWGPSVGRAFTATYPPQNYLVGFHSSAMDCCYDGGWLSQGVSWVIPTSWKLYSASAWHDAGAGYRSRFFIDGVQVGVTATTGDGLGTTYNLSGYDAALTQETCDCEVAELLIYNRELSDADRQTVEGYLRKKWLS